ncbi:hypothetical protein FA95DRAFT_1573701 [Auriscalpium vulgare]|uniref:Uncharacterized protein n=1 Tax=Auriscalpium vulgare TaxID=40419 RepID=A0ACB8RNU2_9AGAM|nr:hypothetical protein FA95DRAFT_1573701 [Auriscalpium vulgare]
MPVQEHAPDSQPNPADPSTSDPSPSRPLLLIKSPALTDQGRILSSALFAAFGISKAVLSYQGQSAAPTKLELISGILSASLLYWLSLFEAVEPSVLTWLLHYDYAVVLVYFVRLVLETATIAVNYIGLVYIYARLVRSLMRLVAAPSSHTEQPDASIGQKGMFYLFPVALIYLSSISKPAKCLTLPSFSVECRHQTSTPGKVETSPQPSDCGSTVCCCGE